MTPAARTLKATLCPLTSALMEASLVRLAVDPSPRNGSRKPSPLMVDKLFTVPMGSRRTWARG